MSEFVKCRTNTKSWESFDIKLGYAQRSGRVFFPFCFGYNLQSCCVVSFCHMPMMVKATFIG